MANTTTKQDEYGLFVGSIDVPREGIATGFLKEHGLFADNAFVMKIVEKLAGFLPDELFDGISTLFYGGDANHTYTAVYKLDDNGNPTGKPLGTVDAMGLTFDKDGKPKVDGDGNLVCITTNEDTFKDHPLHDKIVNNKNLTPLITGDKDTVYQGYSVALRTAQETFGKGPLKYDLSGGVICNALTGEIVDNLMPSCTSDLKQEDFTKLGAGFRSDIFNTAAGGENLKGDALQKQIKAQEERLEKIYEKQSKAPEAEPEPPTQTTDNKAIPVTVGAPG